MVLPRPVHLGQEPVELRSGRSSRLHHGGLAGILAGRKAGEKSRGGSTAKEADGLGSDGDAQAHMGADGLVCTEVQVGVQLHSADVELEAGEEPGTNRLHVDPLGE